MHWACRSRAGSATHRRTNPSRTGEMRVPILRQRVFMAALGIYLFAIAAASAATPSVDANIEPQQIEVGESPSLTILTSATAPPSLTPPLVPRFEFPHLAHT